MIKLVIAPDERMFRDFVRNQQREVDLHDSGERIYYRRALRRDHLFGYKDEILVLNRYLMPHGFHEEFADILDDPNRKIRNVYT